jgi:uncharacterized SAM-dependent methyltransferase
MDQDAFKSDIIDLFSRKRGGHVERWLYAASAPGHASGADLWSAFLRASKNYYVLPNEVALIRSVAKTLKGSLGVVDTVVDFGPGSREAVTRKALPMIRACANAERYVAVDLSPTFLVDACALVSAKSGLAATPVEQNFFKDDFDLPGDNRLGVMFGLTISNTDLREGEPFPRADMTAKLGHVGRLLHGEGENLLLVSFDSNADRASIERAYDDPHWSRFVAHLTYAIAGVVEPGGSFNPSAWRHEAVWNEEAHVLHACIAAEADQAFTLGGHDFRIRKGERFVAINLCKFPVAWFREICADAGFAVAESFFDRDKRIAVQLLHA